MKRYKFQIPIGDWSKDGHGKCDYYDATAAKPIEDVREAYFAAKAKFPKELCPEEIYRRDDTISDELREKIKSASGLDIDSEISMAAYVVWFINQGDPDVKIRLSKKGIPMLSFYGYDKKKRHISFIGYGFGL